MSETLDHNPFNAAMWREYRYALEELISTDDQGDLEKLAADLRASPRDATED